MHTCSHTDGVQSTMRGDSQLVGSSQGEVSRSGTPHGMQEGGGLVSLDQVVVSQ